MTDLWPQNVFGNTQATFQGHYQCLNVNGDHGTPLPMWQTHPGEHVNDEARRHYIVPIMAHGMQQIVHMHMFFLMNQDCFSEPQITQNGFFALFS